MPSVNCKVGTVDIIVGEEVKVWSSSSIDDFDLGYAEDIDPQSVTIETHDKEIIRIKDPYRIRVLR